MSSLVQELQKDALNQNLKVTELLQKSLVVAAKLKLNEFASWVRFELDGYGETEGPAYRVLHGTPQLFNPYRGYLPLYFRSAELAKRFSKMHFNTPIGQIEHDLINAIKFGSDAFQISFSPEVEKMLMDSIKISLQPSLHMNASQFQGILDAVRKIVLEWSLKLEADGITGEGMSFSLVEKERAQAQAVTYNIKNYIHGNINDSQVQIESISSTQNQITEFDIGQIAKFVEALKSTFEVLGLDEVGKKEAKSEIATLEAQISSPNPKQSILRESLSSVRRILEGAAGNLVASGLLNQISVLFGI
jgi:hypothetical protein